MAKWTVTPRTVHNTMSGTFEYDDNSYHREISQDISEHIKDVNRAREELASASKKERLGGYRRMATIPDVVAIRILDDHNIDIHDPQFMHYPANMKKLRYILQTEYPYLLVST